MKNKSPMPESVCIKYGNNDFPVKIQSVFGNTPPQELHALGNTQLLNRLGIGFCGSRKVTENGISVAQDCAKQLSMEGIVVVSGYAKGVDMATHITALECGGETIIVLAEGIDQFRIKKEIAHAWDWNRVLVLSQFSPDSNWTVYRAMERNALIIGLSQAMIVIEAGETGGTLQAGLSTLKTDIPLFVVEYADMRQPQGNATLIKRGGVPLHKSRMANMANLSKVFSAIESPFGNKIQPDMFAVI